MKKSIVILLLAVVALAAHAAGPKQYYDYPDATRLRDGSRMLIYDNLSGNRNITGAKLKEELSSSPVVLQAVATPGSAPLKKQAGAADGPYVRQVEVRDSTGTITMWINASGQIHLGTPVPLSVVSVSPANGATNVSTSTVPRVTLNKTTDDVTISSLYIVGSAAVPIGDDYSSNSIWVIPAALVPNTTYTIKFERQLIVQADGETTSSCGTAMTDVAGVCTSTFTTAP